MLLRSNIREVPIPLIELIHTINLNLRNSTGITLEIKYDKHPLRDDKIEMYAMDKDGYRADFKNMTFILTAPYQEYEKRVYCGQDRFGGIQHEYITETIYLVHISTFMKHCDNSGVPLWQKIPRGTKLIMNYFASEYNTPKFYELYNTLRGHLNIVSYNPYGTSIV
jgi:hypothetical protein